MQAEDIPPANYGYEELLKAGKALRSLAIASFLILIVIVVATYVAAPQTGTAIAPFALAALLLSLVLAVVGPLAAKSLQLKIVDVAKTLSPELDVWAVARWCKKLVPVLKLRDGILVTIAGSTVLAAFYINEPVNTTKALKEEIVVTPSGREVKVSILQEKDVEFPSPTKKGELLRGPAIVARVPVLKLERLGDLARIASEELRTYLIANLSSKVFAKHEHLS